MLEIVASDFDISSVASSDQLERDTNASSPDCLLGRKYWG